MNQWLTEPRSTEWTNLKSQPESGLTKVDDIWLLIQFTAFILKKSIDVESAPKGCRALSMLKTKQNNTNIKSCPCLNGSITLCKEPNFRLSPRCVLLLFEVFATAATWEREGKQCPWIGSPWQSTFLNSYSLWPVDRGNRLPVGLCRMKNRKGLSTMNQGGDDLAIRIAAVGRKGSMLYVQRAASKAAGWMGPWCWCLTTHLTAGPPVTIYWIPTVGQALHSYHLISSTQAPSSSIPGLSPGWVFMRIKWQGHITALSTVFASSWTPSAYSLSALAVFYLFHPPSCRWQLGPSASPNPFGESGPSFVLSHWDCAFCLGWSRFPSQWRQRPLIWDQLCRSAHLV